QLCIRPITDRHYRKTLPGNMTVIDSFGIISVAYKNYSIYFNRNNKSGLSSYTDRGSQQIMLPFLPHFRRPLTDNYRRGWKPNRKMKEWYEYELKPTQTSVTRGVSGLTVTSAIISTGFTLINDSANVKVIYTINDEGVIKVDYWLDVKAGLPNIPKIGMQGGINRNYTQIEYFGRGPLENYVDRRYGMDAGIYNQDIYDFMEPYVVPQENGNRTDVRWMYLSDPKTKEGLLIVGDSLLSMSAWPYTEENIENAKHTNKLNTAGFITLNIDLVQMGVGGNDSWSDVAAPLEQYKIKAQPYHYSFYLVPFNSKTKDPGARAKE